jgi:hypothetical protein
MNPDDRSDDSSRDERKEDRADVTRETLYELVWAEPMLKVTMRLRVSSSYMARVCTLMNVPRPERGYWAKLAVGKATAKPPLPAIRPGDQAVWNRSGTAQPANRPLPKVPATRPKRKSAVAARIPAVHTLIHGAKEHFEVGRTSFWSKYLRPFKRNLVDLVVCKNGIDKALNFANTLFRELEAHECRVVLAPRGERMSRAAIDEHEVPKKLPNNSYEHSRHWSPGRITVAYIGSIAIGLTIIEMSEEAEGRYVNGDYVRVEQLPLPKRGRYTDDWRTSKHDFPSGRLCLQAYCPDWRATWTKQWRATKDRDLTSRIRSIVRELAEAAPVIAALIEEGHRKAELQRHKWEEERREYERQQSEERAAKAHHDSLEELLSIVNACALAKSIEEFFADAEARVHGLDPERRDLVRGRLRHARDLVGNLDVLTQFARWKAPNER